jgi:hypothetical protein
MADGPRARLSLAYGWAEWEDDKVVVGERWIPRRIDVTMPSRGGLPALSMVIEVRRGFPQCTSIHVDAAPDGTEVRTTDVRAVRIEEWVEQVTATAAQTILGTNVAGGIRLVDLHPVKIKSATREIRAARRAGRRRITDELLREVASVYRQNELDRPTRAVGLALGLEPKTAQRYVQRARTAGFLPPTTQGMVRT